MSGLSRYHVPGMPGADMRRRDFIGLVGSAAAVSALCPFTAQAQQSGRIYRLGVLAPSGREAPPIVAFFDELRRSGFVEGQNLSVIPGGFGIGNEQVAELSAAMVRASPDAIAADASAARVLKPLTQSIPIVTMGEDIIQDGLVASLARPEGNITGISILSPELDGKRQDLLMEAVPRARRVAALADARTMQPQRVQQYKDAAQARGIEVSVVAVAAPHEIATAIDGAKAAGAEALNVLAGPLFGSYQTRGIVLQHVAAARLPAIYQWPDMADEGGLMAYGPNFVELYRQRARMVAKVLLGTKPADIPSEQPTRFEFVINLKTARAIGHEIPAGLVLRADRLVE